VKNEAAVPDIRERDEVTYKNYTTWEFEKSHSSLTVP